MSNQYLIDGIPELLVLIACRPAETSFSFSLLLLDMTFLDQFIDDSSFFLGYQQALVELLILIIGSEGNLVSYVLVHVVVNV